MINKFSNDYVIKLKDGRKLGYSEYGDLKGKPIFYFHGWPTSRLQAQYLDPIAKKLGARIISIDRPGYGLSDHKNDRILLDWPDDIIELFGKSAIPHSISEIESNEYLTISSPLLDKFNEFIAEHGTDYASKNLRIHVAHIPSNEIQKVIDGVKKRIHEFLDNLILILEHN